MGGARAHDQVGGNIVLLRREGKNTNLSGMRFINLLAFPPLCSTLYLSY